MKRRQKSTPRNWFAWFALPIILTGCGSLSSPLQGVDYANYEKIPLLPSSKVFRSLLKMTPGLREQVFYGRYGGFGNLGGRPVDPLDNLFRKHDIVYYETDHYLAMLEADRSLVMAMEALDPEQLDEKGRRFRSRAIGYFENPGVRVFGKPVPAGWVSTGRSPYFRDDETIRRFLTDPEIQFPGQLLSGDATR